MSLIVPKYYYLNPLLRRAPTKTHNSQALIMADLCNPQNQCMNPQHPQHQFMPQSLIPGLPDDIARECLFRVCYKSHGALKFVCSGWKSELDSPDFYAQRRARGAGEHLICLIQATAPPPQKSQGADGKSQSANPVHGITVLDTATGNWERLPAPPGMENGIPLFAQCASYGRRILLIGGWNPATWQAERTVFVYDFVAGEWSRGADMPTLRSFFACVASPDGKIYVAGGHDERKNALRAAEVYDLQENRWAALPEMSTCRDECQGAFVNGKFVVVSGYGTENQGRFMEDCEVFDPTTGKWDVIENMWSSAGGGCPRSRLGCCSDGVFCVSGERLLRFGFEENRWMEVRKIPRDLKASCVAMWQQNVMICDGSAWYVMKNSGSNQEQWVPVLRPDGFDGIALGSVTVEI